MPSLSGKTIGTNSFVKVEIALPVNTTYTIDIWGWQLEAGNVATAFQTATGTIQGEIALAQRYYQVVGGTNGGFPLIQSTNGLAAAHDISHSLSFPVKMRVAPTATKNGTWDVSNATQPTVGYISADGYAIRTQASASSAWYILPNGTDDTITFSAEL
jgi:hypothetical protein